MSKDKKTILVAGGAGPAPYPGNLYYYQDILMVLVA